MLLTLIRGAIGKEIVVKHYRYGVVVTRYPDMSGVRASGGQRACREVFGEAVAFAKGVFADRVRKEHYRQQLGKVRGLFQAVVREYVKNVRRETSEVSVGAASRLRTSASIGLCREIPCRQGVKRKGACTLLTSRGSRYRSCQ